MKIYFDTCCYNRPYDDQSQKKIRDEAEAVQNIIGLARRYGGAIFGSVILEMEIGRIKNDGRRTDVREFYQWTITRRVGARKHIINRYAPLARQAGIKGLDIYHLCFAISADADYLVTTDKYFVRDAAKIKLPLVVINPTNYPLGGMIW